MSMKYNSPTKAMQHQLAAMRTRLLKSVEFKWVGSFYCWVWKYGKGKDGYGLIKIEKTRRVHRVSYETFREPIPRGLLVCHRCDNPLCINPNHLFLGTDRDNHNDKRAKGRQAATKLTEADVIAIREARDRGVRQRVLTAQYGVGAAQITRIHQRKRWAHV